jgi:2-methylisocitrate lyase-like PEP mutase family enzyme
MYLLAHEILMIPVAHDPLCAKIIERTGFKVVGCTDTPILSARTFP